MSTDFAAQSQLRCCATHADWPTLAQHLLEEYPEASIADVVHAVREARAGVDALSLDDGDALAVGETAARHQLALITGRADDVARLDPQPHERRGSKHV